jgi:amphi-Trp domain-containing protein
MKSRKIKYADRRHLRACIEQLQAIVDGLRAGSLDMQQGSDAVNLKPGGMVEFELRLEQLTRRETIKLEMNWRPAALRVTEPAALDLEEDEAPISELPPRRAAEELASGSALPVSAPADGPPSSFAPASSVAPASPFGASEIRELAHGWDAVGELGGPLSALALDRIAAAEYQRLYTAARSLGSDGEWHLDKDLLIEGLARAGVDPLTQQEIYSLASQADADGRSLMFSEQAIAALKVASLRQTGSAPARAAGSAG